MLRVLVIDDEAMIRRLLRNVLEQSSYHVDEAENGRLGLEKLATATYDLVITDLDMPETDGLEVVSTVSKRWPDVPVIVISGGGRLGSDDNLPVAVRLGAVAAIHKPFTMRQLTAAIESARAKACGDSAFAC